MIIPVHIFILQQKPSTFLNHNFHTMEFFKWFVHLLKKSILTTVSFFVVITLGPLLFLIALPIYFCRLVVSLVAPCFNPSLGKMMDIRSTFFGPELTDGQESITANIVVTAIFEGGATTEDATKWFQKVLSTGRYPELAQYVTKWGGFYFWKKDKNFDLSNHIKYVGGDSVNENQLRDIEREMVKTKFEDKRSPWEYKVVKNFRPKDAKEGETYSVGLFKVHHGLAGMRASYILSLV